MAKAPDVVRAPPALIESISVRSSAGEKVARVLLYSDDSVRVKVHMPLGASMEECYLGPSRHENVIVKLRPKT